MPTKAVAISILALLALGAACSHAADYYVSKDGRDSANGSREAPWRSLDRANAAARAGDTVNLLSGVHVGVIRPDNSGTATAPIVYRSAQGGRATVSAPSGEDSAVFLSKSHIRVENLRIENNAPPQGNSFNVDIVGGSARDNLIRNCTLVGTDRMQQQHAAGVLEGAIRMRGGAEGNVIENNTIEGYTLQAVKVSELAKRNFIRGNTIRDNWGDAVRIDAHYGDCQANVVENNKMSGSLASDGVQTNRQWGEALGDSSNHCLIIRNNVIHGNGENGIDIKGSEYVLIQGNTIYGNISDNDGFTDGEHQFHGGPGGISVGGNEASRHVIIRNNVIFDNASGSLTKDGWKIYNNTIVANNRNWEMPNNPIEKTAFPAFVGIRAGSSENIRASIKNNIIVDHNVAELSIKSDANLEIDHNLYFNNRNPVQLVVYRQKSDWTAHSLSAWRSVLRDLPHVSGFDANSIEQNPGFVNVPPFPVGNASGLDFSLSAGSPAIDAGTHLTRASGSGSGTVIMVRDAGYFFDGYGAVAGDQVKIGNNAPVRVLEVNHRNNTLKLGRGVSWRDGDPVSLDHSGSAPDIGAFEFAADPGEPKAPVLGLK